MINSVNGLEFLKPKLINMDKFNCTATTKLLPPSSFTQTFVTISGHHQQQHHHHYNKTIDSPQENQQQNQKKGFLLNDEIKHQERVRVQHLENPTELQNNKCWNNFRTLNYTSASSDVNNDEELKDDNEIDVVNVITSFNIQNKSAFNLDLNNKKYPNNNNNSIYGNKNYDNIKMDSTSIAETNNNNNYQFYTKQYEFGRTNNKQLTTTGTMNILTSLASASESESATTQRTEDQNNAYRHIESVHNYAKSKSYEDDDDNQSPNGSRHSSYLDDDEDEEDDDDDENNDRVDADYDNDEDIDYEERLESNVDYDHIFKRRQGRFQKLSTSSDGALLIKSNRINNSRGEVIIDELRKSAQYVHVSKEHQIQSLKVNKSNNNASEEDDIHVDVDVETVESQSSPTTPVVNTSAMSTFNSIGDESSTKVKPDHHARRPMNAFLIFCKRHRAIVKERYKNLENRAITKILGDWWASLDVNDKKCFTNLAQQNKDAFFSANPNFKWYKLPAPPLRTLNTRPANAFGQDYQDDTENNAHEILSNNTYNSNSSNNNHSNYFKLADEAQMGDLSQLMQDKSKTTKQCADLQQALGETSQFMSAHITGNADAIEENHLKRRFHNENSFSSNSSEEDVLEPKKKSSRSCKGKRYQELINSGQIATAVKKSKPVRLAGGNGVGVGGSGSGGGGAENTEVNVKQNFSNVNNFSNNLNTNNVGQKRSVSECDNLMSYDINGFDLEERIKELPALNLDDYLQRKRNTKKKKKFSSNGKKRGQRNSNIGNNNTTNSNKEGNLNNKTSQPNECLQQKLIAKQHQQTPHTVVGSQKRKARKESITRRDVSAIEQEVASLLPLTINGCCYFQEAPTAIKFLQTIEKDTEITTTPPQSLNVTSTSPIIPLQQNSTSTVSIDIFNNTNMCNNNNNNNSINDNISSSTSDLLILAEVAANRTEL